MLNILNDLKPFGAFVENTIRPLMAEIKTIIDAAQKAGIPLTEKNISDLLKTAIKNHQEYVLFQFMNNLVFTGLVCFTVLRILK